MIDGTMERSQPGCHRRTAGWSRCWWPHHHDCPGSANCSPEQGGVPTPYAPCHDDRRSPTNASAVRDDAAPRDPETAGRIIEDTLRQAYTLVVSCQQSNTMYSFLMAGTQAQKFRDIRDRIDSYLRVYPLVSHIDTREFITRLYSRAHPSQPQV